MLKQRLIRLLKDLDIYYRVVSRLQEYHTLDCVVYDFIENQLKWFATTQDSNHIKRWLNEDKWKKYLDNKSYLIPFPDKDEDRKELWDYLESNGMTWCHGRPIYAHQPTPIYWICVELLRPGISYSSGVDSPANWLCGSVINCKDYKDFINRYEKLKVKLNQHANEVIELPSELRMKMNRKK